MKKTIVIEILLLFVLALLIAVAVDYADFIGIYNDMIAETKRHPEYVSYSRTLAHEIQIRNTYISYFVPTILAAFATLAAIIILAIRDFPVFKPLVDKFKAKRAARKEQRAAEKTEQAETAKQERIAELQAELDELKKDE